MSTLAYLVIYHSGTNMQKFQNENTNNWAVFTYRYTLHIYPPPCLHTDTAQKCSDVCWRACAFISASQQCHPARALNQPQGVYYYYFLDPAHPYGSTTTDNSHAYSNQSNARCLNDYFFYTHDNTAGNKGGVYRVETWLAATFQSVCAWVYGLIVWARSAR